MIWTIALDLLIAQFLLGSTFRRVRPIFSLNKAKQHSINKANIAALNKQTQHSTSIAVLLTY